MSALIIQTDQLNIESKPVVTGIPTSAFVEYFGELPGGGQFIIIRPERDWDYNSFLCFFRPGMGVPFKSTHVKKVVRYRDGGTTDIETDIGDFHFPTPFEKNSNPTYAGHEIVEYNPSLRTRHLR